MDGPKPGCHNRLPREMSIPWVLLYQWGRKDPFPGSTTLTGTEEPTTLRRRNGCYQNTGLCVQQPAQLDFVPGKRFTMGYMGLVLVTTGTRRPTITPIKTMHYGEERVARQRQPVRRFSIPVRRVWRVPAWSNNTSPWNGFQRVALPGQLPITVRNLYICKIRFFIRLRGIGLAPAVPSTNVGNVRLLLVCVGFRYGSETASI